MKSCDAKNARERAVAIILLAAGHSKKEAADMLGRNERTIRNWLAKWNRHGLDGLLEKRGHRKPLLTVDQWLSVYEESVKLKLSLPETPKLVQEMFGVKVSIPP